MVKKRSKMIKKLEYQNFDTPHAIRNVREDDLQIIAQSMLEAYRDTVDYEEECIEEAVTEVKKIFNDGYGKFIPEASFLIEMENEAAAVILINYHENVPLITEVFTGKKFLKRGMAEALIKSSINALADQHYEELKLYVTDTNEKAIKLYEKLGFTRADN